MIKPILKKTGSRATAPGLSLRKHVLALAVAERRLSVEVARRKTSEQSLKDSREGHRLLLVQSQILQRKLRGLAHQILSAQEEERRLISRELHDEVVQTLVGINVQLASLSRAATIGTKALRTKIASTQRLVEKSVNAVHQFARELRPSVLDDLGLIPALRAYMKTIVSRKKLRIELTAAASVETLDDDRRTVLYRIAQEALTNVGRHAHATIVNVSIRRIQGAFRMEVRDDGRSFNVERSIGSRTHKRLGLIGMRERVEMVGGKLTIESVPGRGTTVRADIPFVPVAATES